MHEPITAAIHASFRINYPGFNLDVNLELPGLGVTALFGHSGSGKTTVLRCVAGLNRAAQGYLKVNGDVWQDEARGIFLPTHVRPLGYVFQEASLFDHLTVHKNLLYGERRTPPENRKVPLDQALKLLGIGSLLDRRPASLSGGERQRVGIARALLTSPKILLLDEPMAALDYKRKEEILPYLERLNEELGIPMLYVSHSQEEVARLADHLVLMESGKIVASGPIQDVLARMDLPGSFAEDAAVVLDTVVAAHDDADQLTRLDFKGGCIFVGRSAKPLGKRVRCRIIARDVSLNLDPPGSTSILNTVRATVVEWTPTEVAGHVLVKLEAEGTPLLARITQRSLRQLGIARGLCLWAQIKAVALLG